MVLQQKGNFQYRQCWGSVDHDTVYDYDKTQVFNNTIYVANDEVNVEISGGNCPGHNKSYSLEDFQHLGEEPGSSRITHWPSTKQIIEEAEKLLA